MKRPQREDLVHEQVCNYIKMQYPDVIFMSEPSGMFTKSWKQRKSLATLRSGKGLPDLWVMEPNQHHHGLILELKAENASPYKKNGELRSNEHLEEQVLMLARLRAKGYWAAFAAGFDQARCQIDHYMNGMSYFTFVTVL